MSEPDSSSDSNKAPGKSKQASQIDAWANAMLKACSLDQTEVVAGVNHPDGQGTDQNSRSDQPETADSVIKEVATARRMFEALVTHSKKIPDCKELEAFENFSQKTEGYLVGAETSAKKGEIQEAKDNLENAELS